jgi:hypothetical protein
VKNNNIISIKPKPFAVNFIPNGVGKDVKHRLMRFEKWLAENGLGWYTPNLAVYRDDLLARGLAASSVQAHLATIRGRYTSLVRDNVIRDTLFAAASPNKPTPCYVC